MINTTEYDLGTFKGKDAYAEIKRIARSAVSKAPWLSYLREDLEHELVRIYLERRSKAKEDSIGFVLYQEAGAFLSKHGSSLAVGTYKPSDIGTALRNGDGLAIKTLERANEKDREFAERVYLADEDPAVVVADLWPKEGVANPAKRVSNKSEEVNDRLSKVANWKKPPVLVKKPSGRVVHYLASDDIKKEHAVKVPHEDLRTDPPPKKTTAVTRASRNNMALPPWERFDYPEDGYVGLLEEIQPEEVEVVEEELLQLVETPQIPSEPMEYQKGTDMHPALVAAAEMAVDGFTLDERFYPAINGLSEEDQFLVLYDANPEVLEAVKRRSRHNISAAKSRLIELYDSLALVT